MKTSISIEDQMLRHLNEVYAKGPEPAKKKPAERNQSQGAPEREGTLVSEIRQGQVSRTTFLTGAPFARAW
jgi:hypothetical protein